MRALPDHRPQIPSAPLGVGLIGAGAIARSAHLPAYAAWGIPVVGVASRTKRSAEALAADFGLPAVSIDTILADPGVEVVDLAMGPSGRLDLLEAAIRAGKHVLMQKPALADPAEAPRLLELLEAAESAGLRIAVNQNARWAPVWRLATLMIRAGSLGEIIGVTHLHDKPLPPLTGTPFDGIPHMLLADYLVHWFDITACWLEGSRVVSVSAHDSRTPGQPIEAANPWQATVHMGMADGASGSMRIVGDVRTEGGGCPFWIHGTDGVLRGSILRGSDGLEFERNGSVERLRPEGEWFTDGFAGSMGELMTAIRDDREPEHSARRVLVTQLLAFAAVESAEDGGIPVHPERLDLPSPAHEVDRI